MKKLILTIFLALPLAANAENLDLKYEAKWAGIKAGTAEVIIKDDGAAYDDKVRADAVGLVKSFTNYWTECTAKGSIDKGNYLPAVFDAQFQPKKAPTQRVLVTYDKDGSVNEVATPPENRGKRPEVAESDKHGLPDPITAAMIARRKAREIIESGGKLPQNFTIRIFDSRRVTDLHFNVIGYEDIKIDRQASRKLLKVTFTRSPVTGYNVKELKKHEEQNPPVNIYVDENYIPIMASGQAIIGAVSIKLVDK